MIEGVRMLFLKNVKMFMYGGCCLLISLPLMAEEASVVKVDKELENLKQTLADEQKEQVKNWLTLASFHIKQKSYKTADAYLLRAHYADKDNPKIKALMKVNNKYLKEESRRLSRSKYTSTADKSLQQIIQDLDNADTILKENRRSHISPAMKKVTLKNQKTKVKLNDWVDVLLVKLEKKYSFAQKAKGAEIMKAISKTLNANVVVDHSARQEDSFKAESDINYRTMSGKNILNNLTKELGLRWYLENEAIVISKTAPEVDTDVKAEVKSDLSRSKFPRVDLGVLGLKKSIPDNDEDLPMSYQDLYGFSKVEFGDLGLKFENPCYHHSNYMYPTRTMMTINGQILYMLPNGLLMSPFGGNRRVWRR